MVYFRKPFATCLIFFIKWFTFRFILERNIAKEMQYLGGSPSDKIREKIKETGIKQVYLAQKIGISPQHLNKILSKNKDSQYHLQMAAVLGMDISSLETGIVRPIPILVERDLNSLSDRTVTIEELNRISFKLWPSTIQSDSFYFGYVLNNDISSRILKNDLLIFTSYLPLNMSGHIGIAFLREISSIFIGILKYDHLKYEISIYNENSSFIFTSEDVLYGVSTHLERKFNEGA